MEKEELMKEITQAIQEVASKKDALQKKSISRYKPEKVAEILYLYSIGNSQTRMIRKYGFDRNSVVSVLVDYADYFGKFKELSGAIAAKNYMNLSSLEEDLVDAVRVRMESGELEVTFRDLKELSIAEDRKVYTQDDYEDTLKAAKDRLKKIKGEVIDVDGD
jgi:RecJ-like exonuclease